MNFKHPLAIMAYMVLLVAAACMLANRAAVTEFNPAQCAQYCVGQAQYAARGGKVMDPTLQLCRLVSAITFLAAARKLVPATATLARVTRADVPDLQAKLVRDIKPLLERLNLNPDHFHAVVA
jgi:hypothetical protein